MESPANKTQMPELHICKKDPCFKKYRSKKSLKRHAKRKHPISQSPSTPIQPPLLNAQSDPEMKYQKEQQLNDDSITIDAHSSEPERTVSELPYTVGEGQEKNRIRRMIIDDFFTYWDDARVEMRMIDNRTLLLIKHSRIASQNDNNYLAFINAYTDMLYQADMFHLQKMYKLMYDFIENVKREKRYFDWDCLVIAFTIAHDMLMKWPHFYPDIVDMMLETMMLADNDLSMLGGWDNFMLYSRQYFENM